MTCVSKTTDFVQVYGWQTHLSKTTIKIFAKTTSTEKNTTKLLRCALT